MDLGTLGMDLLRQAGTAYIQREFAQPVDSPYIPNVIEQFIDPSVTVLPGTRCKKRRRRRPIATDAEIAQLASLKAIATPSEVKLFLAKRLRN